MTPEQQARKIMSAIVAATIGRTDVADIAERVIAAALAERDREIAFLTEDRADAWKRLSEEEKNSQALRAQRDALVKAVEIALRCGGLTAHYEHMTWPAVRAVLAAGKEELR